MSTYLHSVSLFGVLNTGRQLAMEKTSVINTLVLDSDVSTQVQHSERLKPLGTFSKWQKRFMDCKTQRQDSVTYEVNIVVV